MQKAQKKTFKTTRKKNRTRYYILNKSTFISVIYTCIKKEGLTADRNRVHIISQMIVVEKNHSIE